MLLSRPYYPAGASTPAVWAPPLSLATTRGITIVLFSCRYLDVSVRGVRPAIAVRGLQPRGFPHSDIRGSRAICASPRLFAACHVLLRLREPQASPVRPSRFPFHIPVSRRGCSCSLFPVTSMNSHGLRRAPARLPPEPGSPAPRVRLVVPSGVEPLTPTLSVWCSDQLSYETVQLSLDPARPQQQET